MASFLTALANIGSQYAEGRTAGLEEKEKLAQEKTRTDLSQAQLELERQRLQQEGEASKWMKLTPGELLWNPKTGEFKRPELPDVGTQLLGDVNKMAGHLSSENQDVFKDAFQTALHTNLGDYNKALTETKTLYDSLLAKEQATKVREEEKKAATAEKQTEYQQKLADKRTDAETARREKRQDMSYRMYITLALSGYKVTADEWKRNDLSTNTKENLDQLQEIVQRRPDLFGKFWGRVTTVREMLGSDDEDIARLGQIKENLGLAIQGAHGMRNGMMVANAANSVLNNFKNGPGATLAAINEARNSVSTFNADVQRKLDAQGLGNILSVLSGGADAGGMGLNLPNLAPPPSPGGSALDDVLNKKFGPPPGGSR